MHQVDHAGREAGLRDQVHHSRLAERGLRRRLDDVGVAGGQRVGGEPEGHHRGEVEGTDLDEDAHRLADQGFVDAGGDVGREVAHLQRGNPGRDLDVFQGSDQLAARFFQRLAVLDGDGAGQVLELLLDEVVQPEEQAAALHGRRGPPGVERIVGGSHGIGHISA